jgi:hypothetical protein
MCQCDGEMVNHLLIHCDVCMPSGVRYLEHFGFNGCVTKEGS